MNKKAGEFNDFSEIRCKNCGKLLFTYKNNLKIVDKKAQNVIIVSRCNRCKCDNTINL